MTCDPYTPAASIRRVATRILLAAGTLAGDRIEEERVDDIGEGDTPRIVITADENGQGTSSAGTDVTFDVSINLIVKMIVEDTDRMAVLGKRDALLQQVKTALFSAPDLTKRLGSIGSFAVVSDFRKSGAYINADTRILITATWRERYTPDLTGDFQGLNVTTPMGPGETIVSQFNPPTGS